jgi:hypothetical protein
LIQLREFKGEEDAEAELFADEKEQAAQIKAAEERIRAVNVPGMLKVRLPFFSFYFFVAISTLVLIIDPAVC